MGDNVAIQERDGTDPLIEKDEEWNEEDEGTLIGECESCGEVRPIQYRKDPYIAEVYPEDNVPTEAMCYPCFSNRKDQV